MKAEKMSEVVKLASGSLIVRNCILSWPTLIEPRASRPGREPKYSVAVLLHPDTDMSLLKAAAADAAKKKFPGGVPQHKFLSPFLRAGTDCIGENGKYYPESYDDYHVLRASSKKKPGVIDAQKRPVVEESEIYSGRLANVSVNFFAYDNEQRGVSCGLGNVQLLGHGEPLGKARARAEDEFGVEEVTGGGTDDLDALFG